MKGTPFQLVITGVFVLFLLGGVALFALFGGVNGSSAVGNVVVWGTVDRSLMETVFSNLIQTDKAFQNVTYVQKKPESYENDLVQAFASTQAPDLFMINDNQIVSFKDKVLLIPYGTISQRQFNDTFIDEGQLFLQNQGILGLPLFVNPLVMYWNKDLFAGAGVSTYPKVWSELQYIAPKMTALDTASNVKRSAVALGTYDNVNYSKEIISTLFLQVGNPIIGIDLDGNYVSKLGVNLTSGVENPAQAVLRFYTGFNNASQSTYSWNRALPNSFNAFTSGDLGMYFGFATDYPEIHARNPNLAFGVALIPQTGAAKTPLTYGRMTAVAIPRVAKNPKGALYIAQKMTEAGAVETLSKKVGLPGARRDLLAAQPDNEAQTVFAQSALISRGWFDPGSEASGDIFRSMIESTISGKLELSEAVSTASQELDDAFVGINKQNSPR